MDDATMEAAGAAELLKEQLQCNREQRERRAREAETDRAMRLLRDWQAQRLARTYADLLASERYRPAAEFFLSDIYGAEDFSERDEGIERAYPAMVKVLPDAALHTIALAVEVHVMTNDLDRTLWDVLVRDLGVTDTISAEQYAEAYRRCDNHDDRQRQIQVIRGVGDDLDYVVQKAFIYQMLKLARKPAEMAGFGSLQDFLERGFTAFRHMDGAKEFLDIVEGRETAVLERIYAKHPDPFAVS